MNDPTPVQQPVQPPANPLLQRAQIPGQTFALPSGGMFYKHGELDPSVKNGEVLVFPMVTMDELTIKTPDKLLNGTAVTEVFARCIPQIKRPDLLLAKDVDFLLICLRKVTYGEEMQVAYTHNCENAEEHTYMIPLDPLISEANKLDQSQSDQYTLTLPNSQVVRLVPPKYSIMLELYQAMGDELADEDLKRRVLNTTFSLIESVDDITDRAMINEWLQTIPAGYTRAIGEQVATLSSWGPDPHVNITCKDCKGEAKVEISLNPIHFFS